MKGGGEIAQRGTGPHIGGLSPRLSEGIPGERQFSGVSMISMILLG